MQFFGCARNLVWRVRGTWLWHISYHSLTLFWNASGMSNVPQHTHDTSNFYNFQLRCCLSVFLGGKIFAVSGCVPPNPRQHWFWEDLSRNCNWDWLETAWFQTVGGFFTRFFGAKKNDLGHLHQVKKMGWVFRFFFIHIKFVLGSKDVWNFYIKSTPHSVRMHSPFRC